MKQKPDNETNPRTPSTLLEALEKWHEDDQFQDIIDAIEALPKEQGPKKEKSPSNSLFKPFEGVFRF